MSNFLKIIINTLIINSKTRRLLKLCRNNNLCKFGRNSGITLLHGSNASDIYIGDHCLINGEIISAYNGKIYVGEYSTLGAGSILRAVEQITIGAYTAISTGVVISDNNNHPVHPDDRMILMKTPPHSYERSWINSDHAPIIIGCNCWIGENSRICKGVTIGEGAVVAANTVVTKDVPANSIVAGNPGRIVKTDIDKTTLRKFNL